MDQFKIYRSSAGSGKTYTLVKEYISIAIKYPDNFKKILAITFTNKAAQEMKSRILDQLSKFSNQNWDSMSEELCKIHELSLPEFSTKSKDLLSNIIHNYSSFSVCTIDSFFQNIVKSFSKELGLHSGLNIEMDLDYVIDILLNKIINKINDDKKLLNWLIDFSENKLLNGKNWDLRRELKVISKELFSEKFVMNEEEIISFIQKEDSLIKFLKSLNTNITTFEKKLKELGKRAISFINDHDLEISDFSYGDKGVAGYLQNLQNGINFEFTARAKLALHDTAKWYSKSSPNKELISQLVKVFLSQILNEIYEIYKENKLSYFTSLALKPLLYSLGITENILREIISYRNENGLMLISDAPVFLKKIIDDNETPFIYEKIGNRYKYFLIDEFQDVSRLQWSNLKPLIKNSMSEGSGGLVVGDSKQSIYRWRGGDPSLLNTKIEIDLINENIKSIYLDKNWRSSKKIIEFNNNFFTKASNTILLNLESEISEIEEIELKTKILERLHSLFYAYKDVIQIYPKPSKDNFITNDSSSHNNEQNFKISSSNFTEEINKKETNLEDQVEINKLEKEEEVYEHIISKIESFQKLGIKPKEISILTRNNKEGKNIAEFISQYSNSKDSNPLYKYDVKISSSLLLKNNPAVSIIISSLKWYYNNEDEVSLFEVINNYNLYIKPNEEKPYKNNTQISPILETNWKYFIDKENLEKYLPNKFLNLREEIFSNSLYNIIDILIDIFELDNIENKPFIYAFIDLVSEFCEKENSSIFNFLEWWGNKGQKQTLESFEGSDAISIMTIHQSKGLQFKAVIVPFCQWELDHKPQKSPILWCKSEKENTPPLVPLYYYKNVTNTEYIKDYYKEKINTYFDNLNLLYVAFTRAEKYLTISFESSQTKKGIKTVADLIVHTQ